MEFNPQVLEFNAHPVHGIQCPVLGNQCPVLGIQCPVLGIQYRSLGLHCGQQFVTTNLNPNDIKSSLHVCACACECLCVCVSVCAGVLVESITFNRRVGGSTPALAVT